MMASRARIRYRTGDIVRIIDDESYLPKGYSCGYYLMRQFGKFFRILEKSEIAKNFYIVEEVGNKRNNCVLPSFIFAEVIQSCWDRPGAKTRRALYKNLVKPIAAGGTNCVPNDDFIPQSARCIASFFKEKG